METIQPLFDLANPDHPMHHQMAATEANANNNFVNESPAMQSMAQDEQSMHAQEKPLDQNTIRQLQQFQQMLIRQTNADTNKDSVKFNKKLLDYDYGEDDDDGQHQQNASPRVVGLPDAKNLSQILSDPNILKHLQNIQMLKQNEIESQKNTKLTEMRIQEEKFEKHLATVLKVIKLLKWFFAIKNSQKKLEHWKFRFRRRWLN